MQLPGLIDAQKRGLQVSSLLSRLQDTQGLFPESFHIFKQSISLRNFFDIFSFCKGPREVPLFTLFKASSEIPAKSREIPA